MGNEKQIKRDLIEKSKSEFLPAEFHDPDSGVVTYSIEEEYAKTQKNRNLRLYGFVLLFFAAIAVASLVWVVVLQRQGDNLVVDISDFKDVKAVDIVKRIQELEIRINELKYELKAINEKRDDELSRLNREFKSQREALLAVDDEVLRDESADSDSATETSVFEDEPSVEEAPETESGSTKESSVAKSSSKYEVAGVDSRFRSKSSVIREKYDLLAEKKEDEIRKAEEELANLKKKAGADVELAGTILGEKDELYNLQMNKMRKEYEDQKSETTRKHQDELDQIVNRYNPHFTESRLQAIIGRRVINVRIPSEILSGVEKDLQRERAVTKEDISQLRKSVSNEMALLKKLKSVPYTNSVPRSLLHMESFTKITVAIYDRTVAKLVERVRRKNAMINAYNYAFSSKVKRDGENGFVLDARNKNRIIMYIDDTYEIRDGDTAYIFRSDESEIATVTIEKGPDLYYGKVVTMTADARINPFDKIMLKVVRER